jgi:diacylglycerol kinase (ATP)
MTRRPILLLVNPASGGKIGSGPMLADDPKLLEPEALAEALRRRGVAEVEARLLAEDDDVAALARDAAEAGRDVVVCGGDGTVALAAAALVESEATLGILAGGSFNNVANGFRLPNELDPALDVIARGKVDPVDVGMAQRIVGGGEQPQPHPFFEAAGVGLDAAGFGAVQLYERRGWWRAARALWRALGQRRRAMYVTVDGRRYRTRAPAVTVCNGPYFGMGFTIADDADPADGWLDVAVFAGMGRWEMLAHFARVARRRAVVREPRIRRRRAREVTVEAVSGVLPAHADGQSIGLTPVSFSVRPRALRVFR